jgi:hypothetical protein
VPGGGEKYMGAVLTAVEVVGVAGAMSYLNNKHGTKGRNAVEVMGVPADLALGLLFSGLGVTGYFGEHGKHSLAIGCGFLGAYACRMGVLWGAGARADLPLPPAESGVRGAFPRSVPQSYAGAGAPTTNQDFPWAVQNAA